MRGVVASLLDAPATYRASDGHLFHCDTSWHYDAYGSPLDQTTLKLAVYLGPIARVVVRKASQNSHNEQEFVARVASHLGTSERSNFLREIGYPDA